MRQEDSNVGCGPAEWEWDTWQSQARKELVLGFKGVGSRLPPVPAQRNKSKRPWTWLWTVEVAVGRVGWGRRTVLWDGCTLWRVLDNGSRGWEDYKRSKRRKPSASISEVSSPQEPCLQLSSVTHPCLLPWKSLQDLFSRGIPSKGPKLGWKWKIRHIQKSSDVSISCNLAESSLSFLTPHPNSVWAPSVIQVSLGEAYIFRMEKRQRQIESGRRDVAMKTLKGLEPPKWLRPASHRQK